MEKSPKINVQFPLNGSKLPVDHGYILYAAISRLLPELHSAEWLGIEMISGVPFGEGLILLPRGATLRMRLPADKFGLVIRLAGKILEIEEHKIRLGIPVARPLSPARHLYSRIVTFKNSLTIEKFLETAHREIDQLGVRAKLELPAEEISRHRRIIKVKGKKIVGFSLVARDLSNEDSLKLQAEGLGGRRSMGCGIFNPIRRSVKDKGGNDGI
jgi:CRISPR-associated protein Cas6